MSIKINSDAYYTFKGLLERFCGESELSRFDQELTNRNIFATNMMEAIEGIDIDDDDLIKVFNKFLDKVNTFEIPLIDVYRLCGTNPFNGTSLLNFLSSYLDSSFLQINENSLEKILTALEHSENRAILDIFDLIQLPYIYNPMVYVKPNIQYSYKFNSNYFINRVNVLQDFYSGAHGTSIANAINAKSVDDFTNIELRRFIEGIQQSYKTKTCDLLKFGANSPNNTMLIYIKNFNNKFNTSSYATYKDKCKVLLTNNIYQTDVKQLIYNLAIDLYKPYMYDILAYDHKDMTFNTETYLSSLTLMDTQDITIDTYKYEIAKAYITGAYENIVHYAKEVIMMQNYLTNIYTAILADTRYIMEA